MSEGIKTFPISAFLRPHDKTFDNEFFADRCANDVRVSQTLPNAELSCSNAELISDLHRSHGCVRTGYSHSGVNTVM